MLKYLRGFVILIYLLPAGVYAATISLPQTGQTGCWDSSGNPVACAGTGQDGDMLKGVAWPDPRFTNPDGSAPVSGNIVVDQLTGLVWAKDISAPVSTWQGALDSVTTMNVGSGTFGYTDWRLPNRRELMSLVDRQQTGSLPAGHPFTDVPSGAYIWSSTTYDYQAPGFPLTNIAWAFYLPDGSIDGIAKDGSDSYGAVWPVRGGQFGTSVISALPASKNYGNVIPGTSASQEFTISNTAVNGSSNLAVNSIVLSGADISQFTVNVGNGTGGTCGSFAPVVAAGAHCTITVSFNPSSLGSKSASLRVSGSDVNTPNVDILLSGTGNSTGLNVPGAPTIGTATAGNAQATVAFTPPASDGGSPITLYTATSSPGGFTGTGTASPITVTGLTNGTPYTFTVTATNSVGTGDPSSASNSVTPGIPIIINNGSTYTTKTAVSLTLSYPGAAYMQFSTNGTKWTAWKAYATTTNLTLPAGDGLKTVSVQFGNSNKVLISAVYSATITLDSKKPTGAIVINGGAKYTNTTAVTLSLTATDVTSGVADMQFSPDNKTWSDWEAFNPVKQYDLPAGDGTKKVYVHYKDTAGNISASYSASIILDTTAPTGTIKINGGKTTTTSPTVTLTLSAKGATQMQLSNDGVSWNDWQKYAASVKNWVLAGSGLQTVYVRFEDAAGNISETYSAAITVQ
jgi:hypothetical protein